MNRHLTPYQEKALNYKKHISLTANAGSGKTFVLSQRYVEIAVNENVQIDNIVAITFTEKAASELYRKISNEISGRLQTENDARKRKKLESLRRQLVSANISTIHSFCINILREFAPEADIDANFTPLNETETNDMLDLLIDEEINKKIIDDRTSDDIKYLIRILGSKRNLAQQIKQLIQKRKNVSVLEKDLYNNSIEEIAKKFHAKFEKYLKELFEPELNNVAVSIKKINEQVLSSDANNEKALAAKTLLENLNREKEIVACFNKLKQLQDVILTKSDKVANRGYLVSKMRNDMSSEIEVVENFFNDIVHISIDEDSGSVEKELAQFGKKLLEIYNSVLRVFITKKKQRGYLDFEDILIFTQNILSLEDVRTYLAKKYRYIMVDEYQDTNEIQYEIFMPILPFKNQ